jgi:hypothetical protein
MLCNSGSMWPSVVVHEHWPISQRMIVEMGDYAWSEHIVMVFLACQITIKNVPWSFGVDYSHMETGPLVWWKSFFVTPYRRSCKGLAPTKHFISGQPPIQALCGLALSSMNIGLSANAWLSKWGTTRGASTLTVFLDCQITIKNIQVQLTYAQ